MCAFGQSARINNFRVEHNVTDAGNGRQMLKARYTMEAHGLRGHTLIPVLFIDRQPGVSHYFANNSQMKQDGPEYYVEYEDTYWNGDSQFIGIYNDSLNPLPGKHTYNTRMFVYDKTTGQFIGNSNTPFISFDMTGAAKGFTPGASGLLIDNTYMYDLNGNRVDNVGGSSVYNQIPGSDYNRHEAQCGGCNGSGRCQHCGGTGWVNNHRSKCSLCHGSGRCQSCAGTGKIHGNF